MVRLLGLRSLSFGPEESPREITPAASDAAPPVGSSGWLVRFFDSAFFCEWIAVSYLYKHDHAGVRDYLCNRMYTLPLPGLEAYLFQVCYMLVHKPSPSLDRFVIDTCSKSLRIALKVHWLLAAELELEDADDLDGIDKVQDQCQTAATVQGEWPPLVQPALPSPASSPRGNPMLSRIRSSKQRLLSLASSPSLGLSPTTSGGNVAAPEDAVGTGGNQPVMPPSEDNKLLRRLSIGPKMRDALLFRRSGEKDDEHGRDGFFKRLLRDSRDKEEEDGDREGFFKRLLKDSKDKENEDEDGEKDGFFHRLLRDSKEEDMELTPSSEGLLKRLSLFRDKEGKPGEEDEKEGLFRRMFKDKNEDRRDSMHARHADDERVGKSLGDDDREGFFCKIFKDKNDERKDGAHHKQDEGEKTAANIEDDKKDSLFRQLFKEKNDEKKEGSMPSKREDEEKGQKNPDDENFFRRFFKDRNEEKKGAAHDKNEDDKCDDGDKNFFRKLFKDKHEERRNEALDKNDDGKGISGIEEEDNSEFLSFQRLFRVHPEDAKGGHVEGSQPNNLSEGGLGSESFFKRLFRDRDRLLEDSELFGTKSVKEASDILLRILFLSLETPMFVLWQYDTSY
jgi:phosphatidylinositol 4-kinase B